MSWIRVSVVVGGEYAASLADALQEHGAIAVEIGDAHAGRPSEEERFGEPGAEPRPWTLARVSALFESQARTEDSMQAALADSGAGPLGSPVVEQVEDEDWVARSRQQFQPIRAGERLWVIPSWSTPPDPLALNLFLDPGAAFGTGSHPTTRLCLRWLEAGVHPGDAILDYGCGSGILGIAALKLGAGSAVGVDIDALALEAARYNAERNGVPLQLIHAAGAFDFRARITIANILANPLRMLAPLLASHTLDGGHIVLSGILHEQREEVAAAYAPWARLEEQAREGDWIVLAGAKDDGRQC